MAHDQSNNGDTSADNESQYLTTTHSCLGLLAKPLDTAGGGLTHEVPLKDLHHRIRSLHEVEACRSAVVEATVLSAITQPACFGIKGNCGL